MQKVLEFLSKNLNFGSLNINLSSGWWKAIAVVGLIFLLVLTLAQMRRHYIHWSFKGAVFGVFFGFLLALILEGFLIIGGKTVVTEVLGWRNAPKPILVAIDSGRTKLVQVLGITDKIPESVAYQNPKIEDAVSLLQSLDPEEIKKIKSLMCQP